MKRKIALALIALLLIFPYHIGAAQQQTETTQSQDAVKQQAYLAIGNVGSKDEVVYGRLNANGALNELYVVNMLNVLSSGTAIDYGNYSAVKNLTDLSDIELMADQVQIEAQPGWFYYQGNIQDPVLPWHFDISYKLDGQSILPEELAGKAGQLLLTIKTRKNEHVDPVFFENYTLQLSMSFDTDIIRNVDAPNATIVNVGKRRQLSYTIMPESEGNISLLADVVDFEMDGIDITAIPLSMAIDNPDLEEMTEEMRSLSDAISEINKGITDLRSGVSELNEGLQSLSEGSNAYLSGITELNDGSLELVNASDSIREALMMFSSELNGSPENVDLGDVTQLQDGLSQMAEGLNELATGLQALKENYTLAYSTLDKAINDIPAPTLTDTDIQRLYASNANRNVLEHILEVYAAAQAVKGTYTNIKQVFAAVASTLESSILALSDMSNQLTRIANELSTDLGGLEALGELKSGMAQLSQQYSQFHSGINAYTAGVTELTEAYSTLDSGFTEAAQGTAEMESGVDELADGVQELADATRDLPDQMQEEINTMVEEFSKIDFDPVSFVSPKNTHIHSVQFILKTEEIKLKEDNQSIVVDEEKPGFWQRLWRLFSSIFA